MKYRRFSALFWNLQHPVKRGTVYLRSLVITYIYLGRICKLPDGFDLTLVKETHKFVSSK